jgi:hypothetical protein
MTTDGCIALNVETYKKLKKEYERAVKENQEIFLFENKELLTSYAKYLLEYMKDKLKLGEQNE